MVNVENLKILQKKFLEFHFDLVFARVDSWSFTLVARVDSWSLLLTGDVEGVMFSQVLCSRYNLKIVRNMKATH